MFIYGIGYGLYIEKKEWLVMKEKICSFFENSNNIIKASYFWNTLAGLLNAGQSVVILMVISRINGLEDAGIFSIANAIASLMLTVGNFGMRNYQVTDINEKYSFCNYISSRICTDVLMFLGSLYYIMKGWLLEDYSFYKMAIILSVCLLKLLDSIEDIFEGRCQQKGRLDVAARCLTIRYALVLITLCGMIIVTGKVLVSFVVSLVVSIGVIIWYIKNIFSSYGRIEYKWELQRIKRLLIECIPLFGSAYLSMYIGNAPKYAIDATMASKEQACFNFVFMPVFVVGLLNNFIYQPILGKLAVRWKKQEFWAFVKMILGQCVFLSIAVVLVLAGGYLLGVPVLSFLYSTDLTSYKFELLILLFGGGMLALAGFLNVTITIIRRQKWLLIGYGLVALIALCSSRGIVVSYGTLGAAFLYSGLMVILAVIFIIELIVFIRKAMVYGEA